MSLGQLPGERLCTGDRQLERLCRYQIRGPSAFSRPRHVARGRAEARRLSSPLDTPPAPPTSRRASIHGALAMRAPHVHRSTGIDLPRRDRCRMSALGAPQPP